MNRITTSATAAALLAFGAALSPVAAQAPQQSHHYKRDLPAALVKQATVSESDAAKAAEARVKHGRIQAVELEDEGGKLIYSYELKVAGKSGVEEVNVDARTGKVVNTEHENAKSEAREAAQEKQEAKKPAKPTR
jgi:uncharacterized membrane protein YkoI